MEPYKENFITRRAKKIFMTKEEKLKILRKLEWCIIDAVNPNSCPICGAEDTEGSHEPDCGLMQLIYVVENE